MRGRIRWSALLLALCLAAWIPAQAGSDNYGTAVVEGRTSDRVHLRAKPSAGSPSLGLYYSGTQVECRSSVNGGWVCVTIGGQTGYMMSQYLYDGYYTWTIESDAPQASAAYGTQVTREPLSNGQGIYTIQGNENIAVLGETWDHWCYVWVSPVHGQAVQGYVPASYLSIGRANHSGGRKTYGLAKIDGINSDRVHLRQEASTGSRSLGLFFTGTEVNCLSPLTDAWVLVEAGGQKGYMQSRYLRGGSNMQAVQSRQPSASVRSSSVNLRYSPSLQGALIASLPRGETMTVLGETNDHWYFVRTRSYFGYVKADYITLK